MSSGWVALKPPLTDTSMTRRHCAALIPGNGVVMDAGVVDEDLDRPGRESCLEAARAGLGHR